MNFKPVTGVHVEYLNNIKSYRIVGGQKNLMERTSQFLKAIETRGLSIKTVRAYAFDLLFLIRWIEQTEFNFQDLKQADLLKYIEYQRKLDAKPRSINRRLSTCELFFRFCFDKQIPGGPGTSRPGAYYKGPGKDRFLGLFQIPKPLWLRSRVKIPQTLIEPLEVKEVNTFLKEVSRFRDMGIVMLMLFCGLRFSEVLSLGIDDIDFAARTLKIHGKGNKERLLPLPDALQQILSKYLALERPTYSRTPLFFTVLQGKRRGHAMSAAGLRSLFRYRRLVSKVNRANPHLWRHSFACDLARVGVQLPVLQRLMGHSDPHITLKYIHLSMRDITEEYHRAITRIAANYEQPQVSTST